MRLILLAAALLFAPAASAHEARAGAVTVVHPILRASIGRVPNTAGYMTVRNAGARPDRLLSARCACARKVEAHGVTTTRDGQTRMAPAGPVTIPAGGEVAFAPGVSQGRHLMLTGLSKPAEAGTMVPVTLIFEHAGAVTVPFFVTARVEQELNAHGAAAHHH